MASMYGPKSCWDIANLNTRNSEKRVEKIFAAAPIYESIISQKDPYIERASERRMRVRLRKNARAPEKKMHVRLNRECACA